MSWSFNIPMQVEKARSLPYDAEVEYIFGDHVACIELGVGMTQSSTLTIDAAFGTDALGSRLDTLFSNGGDGTIIRYRGANTVDSLFGAHKGWNSVSAIDAQARHVFKVDDDGFYVDGNRSSWPNDYHGSYSSGNLVLFAYSRSSTARRSAALVYGLKISDNGEDIIDLVPVRVGNVGYMYDKVSGNLLGNEGDGMIGVGPDKN